MIRGARIDKMRLILVLLRLEPPVLPQGFIQEDFGHEECLRNYDAKNPSLPVLHFHFGSIIQAP
jgi:hypothetical protein